MPAMPIMRERVIHTPPMPLLRDHPSGHSEETIDPMVLSPMVAHPMLVNPVVMAPHMHPHGWLPSHIDSYHSVQTTTGPGMYYRFKSHLEKKRVSRR